MKKMLIMSTFCISLLMILILCGGAWDWLETGTRYAKAAFNVLTDTIEEKFKWISVDNPKIYYDFLKKSDELQALINDQLEQFEIVGDDENLVRARKLFDQLEKQQNQLLQRAQKELSAQDFKKLQKDIKAHQLHAKKQFSILSVKDKIVEVWQKYATPFFKNKVNKDNPYRNQQAHVRQNNKLTYQEVEFRQRRAPLSKRGLEKFLGQSLTHNEAFRIGLTMTGGGYRAMTLTTGYLLALEELGLVDASTYITSLSGSTWFLGPWILRGGTVADMKESLLQKIRKNKFDLMAVRNTILRYAAPTVAAAIALKAGIFAPIPLSSVLYLYRRLIGDIVWPKFLFGQPISSVDLYGSLLAYVLLADFGDERQKQHLAEQWQKVRDGSRPLPIYTAVSMHKQHGKARYNWYEFNPIEVRNLDLGLTIPAYAFGSEFERGISEEIAPQQSMGYLMGIFGSAYAVNFRDLKRMGQFEATESTWKKVKRTFKSVGTFFKKKLKVRAMQEKIADKLLSVIPELPTIEKVIRIAGKTQTIRFSPAQVNNPFKHVSLEQFNLRENDWLKEREYVTLIDGGIAYNIPGRPLLRPERHVDVIIIGESSGNVDTGEELIKLLDDAKQTYGYTYVRVDDGSNKTLQLWKDMNNDKAPRIIYVNFLKDEVLMAKAVEDPVLQKIVDEYRLHEFDPERCLADGYCGTFNFNYSENDFNQLSGMAYFNMMANKAVIAQFLTNEFVSPKVKEELDIEFEWGGGPQAEDIAEELYF